jgi:O-succinylbenzoic acid--CoA ligase
MPTWRNARPTTASSGDSRERRRAAPRRVPPRGGAARSADRGGIYLRRRAAPGEGMSDLLSIRAAAADAGPATALVCAGRHYSFIELAALVEAALPALEQRTREGFPHPLVAGNSVATVVTLLGLLELRIPALLVHPRLTAIENEALLAEVEQAGRLDYGDAAAIIHTAGTTGKPRGAVLTRSALLASAAASAANLGWQDDERWLACMPVARVGGLSILTRSLAARRTVVLTDGLCLDDFPELLKRERITLVSLVPTMLTRILDAHPEWAAPALLRALVVGGAPASPRLLARAAQRRLPIVLTYGMTETCSQVVATPYAQRFAPAGSGSGRPLSSASVRVVAGRIEVKGPMLMAGYWPGQPLAPDAWFDTGDLGAFDAQGFLHVQARRADLIVTGGENVYPVEVEQELERCPGIAEAAVFGIPDETWGQTVAAILVADGGAPPDDAALARWIEARLASHKRPRQLRFVPTLPQTPAGKLDRTALAALCTGAQPPAK